MSNEFFFSAEKSDFPKGEYQELVYESQNIAELLRAHPSANNFYSWKDHEGADCTLTVKVVEDGPKQARGQASDLNFYVTRKKASNNLDSLLVYTTAHDTMNMMLDGSWTVIRSEVSAMEKMKTLTASLRAIDKSKLLVSGDLETWDPAQTAQTFDEMVEYNKQVESRVTEMGGFFRNKPETSAALVHTAFADWSDDQVDYFMSNTKQVR